MPETILLQDKHRIHDVLNRNPGLNVYAIGLLDDFYWPHTKWHAFPTDSPTAVIPVYSGGATPMLFAMADQTNQEEMTALLAAVKPLLPNGFSAQLTPGLIDVFGSNCIRQRVSRHHRMVLKTVPAPSIRLPKTLRRLSADDLPIITPFYEQNYPENWFDPRMLETGKFLGMFEGGLLIGIAGVHVYSPEFRAAALGSIAISISHGGRPICKTLLTSLCQDLLRTVVTVGLNVKTQNEVACLAYQDVGFETIGEFDEYDIKL
jgi:ribosomal protein S18 acetylase RimI-like enzyme